MSPIRAFSPANMGPKKEPVTNTEINFNGIFTTVPIRKVQKIESKAVIAVRSPSVQRFFEVSGGKNFFIKKLPFLQYSHKKGNIMLTDFAATECEISTASHKAFRRDSNFPSVSHLTR